MSKEKSLKQTQMRRCASCRINKHKSEFLRIVKLADGKIFVDVTGKAQGRGAYVCKNETCAADLRKKRRLDKQFKTKVDAEIYDAIFNSVTDKSVITTVQSSEKEQTYM